MSKCEYCSFSPESSSDYCEEHRPVYGNEVLDLSDEALLRLVDTPRMNYNGTLELIRRYNNKNAALKAAEVALEAKRKEIRIYGDHIGGCPKRPCECGFQKEWQEST